jgi:MFS family permease
MSERLAVWALAFGQALGYACFFYTFAALILYWQRDFGWSYGLLATGPALAVVVSAVLSPAVGRALDQGAAVAMLTVGPILGAASLAVLALSATPAGYLLGWAGLGVAQAICLYDVCFALLIRRHGTGARPSITNVTLVAGLASTLAFPAAAALTGAIGWRGAIWVAVAVSLAVTVPLNFLGARAIARGTARVAGASPRVASPWRQIVANPQFIRLAVLFAVLNLNHWMLINLLRPILDEMGISSGIAIAAASTVGPAQVAGRIALMAGGTRLGARMATVITVSAAVLAPVLLILAGAAHGLVFGFAILQGAAMGIMTILRPVLVAETLGQDGYGATVGLMSIPGLGATAVAPIIGAGLIWAGGGALLIAVGCALAVAAMALVLTMRRAV